MNGVVKSQTKLIREQTGYCWYVSFEQVCGETGFNTPSLYVAKDCLHEVSLCNTSEQSKRTGFLSSLVTNALKSESHIFSSKFIS